MKKFKSLMLAALATAAMAAPSFADNHGGPNLGITSITGTVGASLTYSALSVDGDDTVTKQDTVNELVNISFNSDLYSVLFEKDGGDPEVQRLKIHPSTTSGDNTVKAYAEFNSFMNTPAIGDYYINGSNKTLAVQVGKFGTSNAWDNGMGVSRASVGINETNIFSSYEENLDIPGFEGLQLNMNAGDIKFEAAIPWMNVDTTSVLSLQNAPGGTNVTGIRPKVSVAAGAFNVTALAYSLAFSAADAADDPESKASSGFQLMGNVAAGAATVGLGYTSQTREDAGAEVTPNALNGYVKVALGGGQTLGASFDILNDGADDATTATRISASYSMPFFVEAVTLSLGLGSATQDSDAVGGAAGSASSAKAKWVYAF